MRPRRLDRRRLRQAYERELSAYRSALVGEDEATAWLHLERAHILSQRYFTRHWHTHWLMLRMARTKGDKREVRGQIRRLGAVPLGWLGGWVPKGNTGGTNVHPLKPMAISVDIADDLAGYSPWKDVAVRVVVVGLLVSIALWARAAWAETLDFNGESLAITSSAGGYCDAVENIRGGEDIVIDAASGLGFAVGGDRRAFRGGGDGRSSVFAFSLSDPEQARDVTPTQPPELKGFGADLWKDQAGQLWLGIANRASQRHSVEIYSVGANGALEHQATLAASGFINPNDLVLLSNSRALVTLDKRSRASSLWEIVEGVRRARTGRVVEIFGGSMKTIADGLLSSNGIVRLMDGRIAVGELVGRQVSIFQTDGRGELELERSISLPFAVDNLTSPDGRTLWAAGHPKLFTLARGYQKDENAISPSRAAIVDPTDGRVETVFEDSGKLLSGSSVAVMLPDQSFLVGTAFGPSILRCTLQTS